MLGKRITAIRPVILECDPAIIGGNYKAYKDSLFDEKHLQISQEDKPTYFKIKQLTESQKDAIAGETSIRRQAKLAVRCALVGVENYCIDDNGEQKPVAKIEFEEHICCGKIVSDAWMTSLGLPTKQLLDLYLCVDAHSEASLPLSRPSSPQSGQLD